MSKILNKLVRDNIIEIIKKQNKKCSYRYLNDTDFNQSLKEKLMEESREVYDAMGKEDLMNEIADVLEVVEALIQHNNLDRDEILKMKKQKALVNGKFNEKIYLVSVEE